MGVLKKVVILSIILPFFSLTLSFCCFKMITASAHAMNCCPSMASSDTMQHGLNPLGIACAPHSSKCQCEQLTESYDKAGLKSIDSQKSFLNNPKAITFTSQTFTLRALDASLFLNYQSPPKIVQNSLPLYLQLSVLRI